jgi:hypothetical protein
MHLSSKSRTTAQAVHLFRRIVLVYVHLIIVAAHVAG